MLKPGESVAKALRRLGGGAKVKNSEDKLLKETLLNSEDFPRSRGIVDAKNCDVEQRVGYWNEKKEKNCVII